MTQKKILIIDDEKEINKLISSYLSNEQFVPLSAYNGREGLHMARTQNPDLIILDIMLPDMDGPSLCLEIRKLSNAPIIFLSCKTQEIDKIIALSSGGDDYMTKPFMPGELIARIKAHLRRLNQMNAEFDFVRPGSLYELEGLTVDFDIHELLVDGNQVSLTTKEFEILRLLIENPRKVFSANQIFESIWKTNCMENDTKTVMVYISTLRKKLDSDDRKYIISVRGVGYKFNQSFLK
ncbi:MAG: response regulator transcription factor [Anaerovoracaceae bacterium]